MFSWGDDRHQGFRLKKASNVPPGDAVRFLNLSFQLRDLSAGSSVITFIKTSGDASVIRTDEGGRRATGKQKFVEGKVKAVSCGDDASVTLLSESGLVSCVDTTQTPFIPRTPEALRNVPVCQVACGSRHTVVLTRGGQVFTWARDGSPRAVPTLAAMPLVQVAAGGDQSFVLSASGGVFGWGRNHRGQLGLGDTTDRSSPTPVRCLNMKKTVHISCGQEHTAILTKDGAVFTFGSGRFGQLGHNSTRDELRPRLVAELWGAKVCRVACGRDHTLVLTDSGKVFSFGRGEQGQLGHGEKSHSSVPLPVQLPHDVTNGAIIQNIYAGGNCSFATCTPHQDNGSSCCENNTTQLDAIENMIDEWAAKCHQAESWATMKQDIHRMFSSAACMNRSFLDRSKDKHFQTSPNYSGLDLSLAHRGFGKLVQSDAVSAEVEAAVLELLQSLDEDPVGLEGLRIFLLLTELLHAMQNRRRPESMRLAEAIAAAAQRLSAGSLQITGVWWSSLGPSTMTRHVKVWKNVLSGLLYFLPVPRVSVQNVLQILQNMYNANKEKKKIPEASFGADINPQFLGQDLQLWRATTINKVKTKVVCLSNIFSWCRVHSHENNSFSSFCAFAPSEASWRRLGAAVSISSSSSQTSADLNCDLLNRREYVDAYVNHAFNTSVESAFQEFERGFFQVCERDLVQLFGPEELQGVLVGKDQYDWAKFKQNTVYDLYYHAHHPTIRMFWEVFDELTEEQKKDFLWFLTGFRKVPILGMDQIQMSVELKQIQSASHDQYFPESLTCHSILYLPLYSTKEVMRVRLTEALRPERGFSA
ncbi:probable E3 ubiquitin-protein ligase HERC3 [Stegastes partitus]|uniref:Probable E3 ubiquitin-protein ligase HERC3 n=1 Tax=Stegastes partitus TaxID=144197 RepID=A0A9Y4NNP9_9TELE|nr:PREDICTED: probable E3 ubiquitin-protein ligase HERC3 [Stegastes partitus]